MYRDGKARAIGVSNYTSNHLHELLNKAAVKPVVNQVGVQKHVVMLSCTTWGLNKTCQVHEERSADTLI